jgi:hypothetical protein
MKTDEAIARRFEELKEEGSKIKMLFFKNLMYADPASWGRWSTSALNLLEKVFGRNSVPFQNLKKLDDAVAGKVGAAHYQLEAARGIFAGASREYKAGFFTSLSTAVSGELFGDFVRIAKHCLDEGFKDPAAVMASAALEDVLKRYATLQGLAAKDKSMQEVVNALKSKGLVRGAQKSLLDSMPKIRDYAMHANWDKIGAEEVSGMIGFVEQFLITHF